MWTWYLSHAPQFPWILIGQNSSATFPMASHTTYTTTWPWPVPATASKDTARPLPNYNNACLQSSILYTLHYQHLSSSQFGYPYLAVFYWDGIGIFLAFFASINYLSLLLSWSWPSKRITWRIIIMKTTFNDTLTLIAWDAPAVIILWFNAA